MNKVNSLFLSLAFASMMSVSIARAQHAVVVERGFLYDGAVPPTCHAATIVEADNGDMIAAFFGGTHEGHPDSNIWMCRRQKKDSAWTTPQVLCDGVWTKYTDAAFNYDPYKEKIKNRDSMFVNTSWLPVAANNSKPLWGLKVRKPCYNPVLYKTGNGNIVLDYKIGSNMQDWTGWEVRSRNNGKNWSRPRILAKGAEDRHLTLGPIKNKPLVNQGRIIAGSSTEVTYDSWKVHFEISDDDGSTWAKREVNCDGIMCIQPAVLNLGNGHLKAYCRTRHNVLSVTESHDNGWNWTPMRLTSFPNNDSGIDAVTLRDGRHLIIYNDSGENGRRSPLSIAISSDGENWTKLLDLEPDDRREYSYPCIYQASDNTIWVLYTWHRKKIAYAIIELQ